MDTFTQRFIAISNKLLAELRLLRNGIEKLVGAVHDAEEAQSQQRQQQPPIVRAELQVPEAIERERGKRDERHYRVQVWLAIATTLAFIAAAVYAGIAALQWRTMNHTYKEIRKQTSAIQDTAKAAADQAKLLRQQLVGTQAAVIRIEPRIWPDTGSQGQLSLLLTNDGRVAARNVTVEVFLSRVRMPDRNLIPNSTTKFLKTFPVIDSGEPHARTFEVPIFGAFPHDESLFRDTKIAIAIDIRPQYDDGFGDIIKQSVCYYGVDTEVKTTNATRGGAGVMPCDINGFDNALLENVLKEKSRNQREVEPQQK